MKSQEDNTQERKLWELYDIKYQFFQEQRCIDATDVKDSQMCVAKVRLPVEILVYIMHKLLSVNALDAIYLIYITNQGNINQKIRFKQC